jgi:hypothetical protein
MRDIKSNEMYSQIKLMKISIHSIEYSQVPEDPYKKSI